MENVTNQQHWLDIYRTISVILNVLNTYRSLLYYRPRFLTMIEWIL